MYKASELRVKTKEELLQLISELKGKLLALRFESATGQLTETHLPSVTRKDIALIFTVLKEKENGLVFETDIEPSTIISKTSNKNETIVQKEIKGDTK
ncbi:MAG: 50S ribosomal protein L29 [Mycoplasmataceae bacterium]|nr:50S ribosomal protein L29 [Mycoplasmataceae bacterium]